MCLIPSFKHLTTFRPVSQPTTKNSCLPFVLLSFFNFPTATSQQPAAVTHGRQTWSEALRRTGDIRVNTAMPRDFSTAKSVLLKCNTNLCPSAPVQRLFSLANLILRLNRQGFDDAHFEKMPLLKCDAV